ncbi:polyphosphate kinase 2 [Flexithrix dorotheae]|uniref:polyphosphate kinase 2 n=1 Tax=Flexithrix dorotheae TaxID=70993 RepID=UPI0003643C83|nr:polyphosphate kinase 2 [Flexithrix dorotheae]
MAFHSLETDPVYINLQTEMVSMQRWVMENNKRIAIIFEGRDTAGKGGAIMRFVRFINPRGYRVVAKPKPTETEMGQWYFQRYIKELPDPGQIVFFDRSWYNRAVVEPVMGFCSKEQYREFLKQVVALEEMLINDGIILIKFWFSIDVDEQKSRLENRKVDPLKQWKLSTVDMQAQLKWHEFTKYKEAMFEKTGTSLSPWVVIKGNDRDKARLEAMRYVLNNIDYPEKGITKERLTPDPEIVNLQINN